MKLKIESEIISKIEAYIEKHAVFSSKLTVVKEDSAKYYVALKDYAYTSLHDHI
jgi:hypothetical protein